MQNGAAKLVLLAKIIPKILKSGAGMKSSRYRKIFNIVIELNQPLIKKLKIRGSIMEKILLFNTKDTEKLKKLVLPMHIKVVTIDSADYKKTIGELVKLNADKTSTDNPFTGNIPDESLMLFCNIPDQKMDKILLNIRKNNIQITYKAILTPFNSNWTVLRLFLEMEREHKAYLSAKNNNNT